MTDREVVLGRFPDAVARCVQPQIRAIEAYERGMHWAVFQGANEDARTLGVSLDEDSAWREAADALR